MGDTGMTEMVPDQRVRYVSDRNLCRHSERCRPGIRPASGVEHGQDPEINRADIHPSYKLMGNRRQKRAKTNFVSYALETAAR